MVSAASVCAKVTRDRDLKNWIFREQYESNGTPLSVQRRQFTILNCSGYPGDEKTINWLKLNGSPVFGYPSLVRHSWKTIKTIYGEPEPGEVLSHSDKRKRQVEDNQFVRVEWENIEDVDEQCGATQKLFSFIESVKRNKYFQDRRLQHVTSF